MSHNGDITSIGNHPQVTWPRCPVQISIGAMSKQPMNAFVLSCLMLMCSLCGGCNFPLVSYPRFWDYTKTRPKDAELVGTYRVLQLRLPSDLGRSVRERDTRITLKADHTADLADLPEFDGFGEKLECRLSGSATWRLDEEINSGWGWSVVFQNYHPTNKATTRECNYENTIWGILVLSRHAPYRLYSIVGDPDSDTGIEFERADR